MAASAASQRLERVERFLDNVDKVNTPGDLQDPFRSLWLRIHGERPTMMSEDRKEAMLSGGFSKEIFGDVQISSAKDRPQGSIEVVSPRDVGPTVQMEMEDDKVTFKMAKEDDLKKMEAREKAADLMLSLQRRMEPLSGLGGEVAKVWEGITLMASEYKNQDYGKAVNTGNDLDIKIETDEFKKSVVVELQKKINEYEDIGAEISGAKDKFRELASSLKDDDSDFITIAGKVNTILEKSIEGIIEEEIVAQVKRAPEEKEKVVPRTKKILKRTITKKTSDVSDETEEVESPVVEEDEISREGPESEIEDEERVSGETAKEEKPVIKVVTVKKLVPVQKAKKEREEYRSQVGNDRLSKQESKEDLPEEADDNGTEETEVSSYGVSSPAIEKIEEPASEDNPQQSKGRDDVSGSKELSPSTDTTSLPDEKSASGDDERSIQNAFKKYQLVYNASLKMHEAGKDLSQLFDLMNYAEQARQKGDMRTYVGVCDQMENMLISMQS